MDWFPISEMHHPIATWEKSPDCLQPSVQCFSPVLFVHYSIRRKCVPLWNLRQKRIMNGFSHKKWVSRGWVICKLSSPPFRSGGSNGSSGALPLTWWKSPTFTSHPGIGESLNMNVYFCSLHHCTQLTVAFFSFKFKPIKTKKEIEKDSTSGELGIDESSKTKWRQC